MIGVFPSVFQVTQTTIVGRDFLCWLPWMDSMLRSFISWSLKSYNVGFHSSKAWRPVSEEKDKFSWMLWVSSPKVGVKMWEQVHLASACTPCNLKYSMWGSLSRSFKHLQSPRNCMWLIKFRILCPHLSMSSSSLSLFYPPLEIKRHMQLPTATTKISVMK